MLRQIFILLAVTATSFWIYHLAAVAPITVAAALVCTTTLFFALLTKSRPYWITTGLLLTVVIVLQAMSTQSTTFAQPTYSELYHQTLRTESYSPKIRPLGQIIERSRFSTVLGNMQQNLFEALDPNLYFLANHPRERVGVGEFEKFSYLFLPLFVIGLYQLVRNRQKLFCGLAFGVPLVVTTIAGHNSPLGPIGLFPFFVCTIAIGIVVIVVKYDPSDKLKTGSAIPSGFNTKTASGHTTGLLRSMGTFRSQ